MRKKIIFWVIIFVSVFVESDVVANSDYEYIKQFYIENQGETYSTEGVEENIDIAIEKIKSIGINVPDINFIISPNKWVSNDNGVVYGVAYNKTIVLATNRVSTIYHEIGHIIENNNPGLLTKYYEEYKKRFPNIVVSGSGEWSDLITEDFAEEFACLFTDSQKRTNYPKFQNFESWLVQNISEKDITRGEVFDILTNGDNSLLENLGVNIYLNRDNPITKSELSKVVYLYFEYDFKLFNFADITTDDWEYKYASSLVSRGVISSNGSVFNSNNTISYREFSNIIDKAKIGKRM